MWEAFRKIGFFLAVLIISAGIYFVFYADEDVQQDVLEYSLNLMGDKLLAMVPEGSEKIKLTQLYNGFKERAIQGNVAPEQIEHVAANILNVSNSETSLTPQQAEGIFRAAMIAPRLEISILPRNTDSPKGPPPQKRFPRSKSMEILGGRLITMFEFNEHIHIAMKEHEVKRRQISRQIRYHVQNGLKLKLDSNLKEQMELKEFRNLAKELRHLEQEQLLDWRENLEEELEREMAGVKVELEALQESLDMLKEKHIFEALEGLEALKSLKHLQQVPAIDPDSIRKVVEKSLREAGIQRRYKKRK